MRSYKQYCGLAKALDVIGDRWTLLVIRELMLFGKARYTDLQHGLPGIATNLLAERLRELEEAGVVKREEAPPPIAATLFSLTDRGEELWPAMAALGHWGAPLLAEAPADDNFHTYWLGLPLGRNLKDKRPLEPPIEIELRTGDEPAVLRTSEGGVEFRRGRSEHPDLVVTGPYQAVYNLLSGRVETAEAKRRGVSIEGETELLARIGR